MAGGQIGTTVVVCPSCGTALEVPLHVQSVVSGANYTVVAFRNESVDHSCEGRS